MAPAVRPLCACLRTLCTQALAATELQGRYEYSIVGHSGETDGEEFVSFAAPPADRGSRLKVRHYLLCPYYV